MAVIGEQMWKREEQKFKKEGGCRTKAEAESLVELMEKETEDKNVMVSGEDPVVCKEKELTKMPQGEVVVVVEEEEPEEFKEWRERERKCLEYLEDVTSNPRREQEKLLAHILKKNADTAYLKQFKLNGATDVESFKKHVPVSNYDDIHSLVDRIKNGDKSPLLSADPAIELMASSGTTNGTPKLFTITKEDKELRGLIWNLTRPVLNKQFPGLEKGKCLFFYFVLPEERSPGGVLIKSAVTSFIKSNFFQERPFDPSYNLVSPDAVILAKTYEESMYCHLVCALLDPGSVLRIGAIFISAIVRVLRLLEDWWPELCDDIENGTLSTKRVPTSHVRKAMLPLLKPNPELAESIRAVCSPRKWQGIVKRLWPNVKLIDSICTGSMEAYTPLLSHYCDNLPIICTQLYAATEGYFGLNMNTMDPPENINYTLLPSMAYYEFIPVEEGSNQEEILDLESLEVGKEYEILVTTVSGLCRYRVGDILQLVGYYNKAPYMQFKRRQSCVLAVDTEKTDENDLHVSVTKGAKLLQQNLGLRLVDFTSTADYSSTPGHYVIFLELEADGQTTGDIPVDLLEQCCSSLEASLGSVYRKNRTFVRSIGPLELRLVKSETFEQLARFAYRRGASQMQYKTPRGFGAKHLEQLEILNSRVRQRYVTRSFPPYKPAHERESASAAIPV